MVNWTHPRWIWAMASPPFILRREKSVIWARANSLIVVILAQKSPSTSPDHFPYFRKVIFGTRCWVKLVACERGVVWNDVIVSLARVLCSYLVAPLDLIGLILDHRKRLCCPGSWLEYFYVKKTRTVQYRRMAFPTRSLIQRCLVALLLVSMCNLINRVTVANQDQDLLEFLGYSTI